MEASLANILPTDNTDGISTAWITSSESSCFAALAGTSTLQERVAALPEGPHIIVVPTSRQRTSLLRSWALYNGRGEPPEILTMIGLHKRLARIFLPDAPRVLPDASVGVLLRAAARRLGLRYGAVQLTVPRLARWAQEGQTPNTVLELAAASSNTRRSNALRAAATLWSDYTELLGTRSVDRGSFGGLITSAITGDHPAERLVVFDTHGLSATDRAMIFALAQSGWDVAIGFCTGGARTESDKQWLVANGWHVPELDARHSQTAASCSVHAWPSRTEEVRRALAVVKQAVAQGVLLQDVALCVVGSSEYMQLIADVASASGVPLDCSQTVPVSTTYAARTLHHACSIVSEGWQRRHVERLLLDPSVRQKISTATDLLRFAREERIPGGQGPDEWTRIAEARGMALRSLVTDDETEYDDVLRRLHRVERAIDALQRLAEALRVDVDRDISAAEFASIIEHRIAPEIGTNSEHVITTLYAYAGVCRDHEVEMMTFAEHHRLWWSMVVGTATASAGNSTSGLAIVRPAELRGGPWRLVIGVGFVDGEFPRYTPNMLDEDVLPGVEQAIQQESMIDVVRSVQSNGHILLFYPATNEGVACLPSSLLPTPWGNVPLYSCLDPEVRLVLEDRDVAGASKEEICMDTSQDGMVLPFIEGAARDMLLEDLSRPVSPSRLDVMASCPYRFLANKILRLDTADVNDFVRSPLETGSALHKVLFEFYKSLAPRSIEAITAAELLQCAVRLDQHTESDLWDRLQSIFIRVMATEARGHVLAEIEYRTMLGTKERPGLLRHWLAREIADAGRYGLHPALFEYEISTTLAMGSEGTVPVPVKLRIDRIDVGEHGGSIVFQVIDYKAKDSSQRSGANLESGRSTQMPLYLAAVQAHFAEHGIDAQPMRALYRYYGRSLRQPSDVTSRIVMSDDASERKSPSFPRGLKELGIRDQVQKVLGNIAPIITAMQKGEYPVRPVGNVCTTCSVSTLCRIEHWLAHPSTTEVTRDEDTEE